MSDGGSSDKLDNPGGPGSSKDGDGRKGNSSNGAGSYKNRNDDNGNESGSRKNYGFRRSNDSEGRGHRGGSKGGNRYDGGSYQRRNDCDNEGSGFRGGPRGGDNGRHERGGFSGGKKTNNDGYCEWSWDDNNQDSGSGNRGWEDSDDNGQGFSGGQGAKSGGNRFRNREVPVKGDDNSGKPAPVTYIPPEEDSEDSLFTSGISSGINFSKYESFETRVSGDNPPTSIHDFNSCGLRALVLENISRSGYTIPTPVQKYSIPIISAKRDLMACAQTGSGKTAAFLIPIINNLLVDNHDLLTGSSVSPHCIILGPTRELCTQTYNEARKFASQSYLKIAKLYGGVQVSYQSQRLLSGCHILVATPGRLIDFLERGKISFSCMKYLVLDEADRMLDLGFINDINKIFLHPTMVSCADRVTLFFSATFPYEIQELAAKFLNDYLFLTVGIVGGACTDVDQEVYPVLKFGKRDKLMEIMRAKDDANELTLIFVETKRHADFLAVFLCENDFRTTSIHGDRFQCQREEALRDFKTGRMPTLVATAVAARGLDIKNVAHVINYDLPRTIDEYVHRIGRTGRVGNRGRASSFFDLNVDVQLAQPLIKILEQAGQRVPPFLKDVCPMSYEQPSYDNGFGGVDYRDEDCSNFKANGRNRPVEVEKEEE